mmetsp:Transcript_24624/g.36263  ORF Transcript_24624/g.36263 Transcript_24624/m.36263 type:complete len:2041 (+) Transcript_24624:160-6282(+)|eukprot:CAMPEP_0185036558 /NCGR_PEP_ID=MMETSP1103-20130426/29703_1 /TAXON_ID=36769 /ORGANISM="Paraphysomonas bandaiensis, Strain Caron Lab Isolate" /LENGTH=2040 /DNA_ID=CAMNT_0027574133 /DNA_START=69 /DNA_END=6191 /DNA_ORIENTATION=+
MSRGTFSSLNEDNVPEMSDDDVVLHGSLREPFSKYSSGAKYRAHSDCDSYSDEKGSASDSSERDSVGNTYCGMPTEMKPRVTIRESFDDVEEKEEVLHVKSMRSSTVAPAVLDIENSEINKFVKHKPARAEKTHTRKGKHGESLSTEDAVQFMIKERQAMDSEYASLRNENETLRSKLSAASVVHSDPVVVERVVEKIVKDDDTQKWKADAQRLRAENEELRRLYKDTQANIAKQKELAREAQLHPLSLQRSDSQRGQESLSTNETSPASEGGQNDAAENIKSSTSNNSRPRSVPQGSVPRLQLPRSDSRSFSTPHQEGDRMHHVGERVTTAVQPKLLGDQSHSGLPLLLWKGAILWKIPYNGRGLPERRLVMIKRASHPGPRAKPVSILSGDEMGANKSPLGYIVHPPTIIWANPDKKDDLGNARELTLYEGAHVVEGHQSPAFWKCKSRGNPLPPEQLCFSIVTSSRSLDLAAESVQEALAWKNAVHTLLVIMSSNTDWAIDNLKRKKPTWRHQELESPPTDYRQRRGSDADGVIVDEERDSRQDLAYLEAANSAVIATRTPSLKDQMFAATRSGKYDVLHNILRTNISVNLMEPEDKDTPLMIACRRGMEDITRLCLHYGGRNDPHPDFGQTALHCAVESKSHKCARVLLEAAAPSQSDVIIANLRDSDEKTPLHISAGYGDTKMSRLLLSHGADLSLRDKHQKSAIHLCAACGHKICLSFLLDHGGDSYLDSVDGEGNTALHYAAANGHLACARLLLETAANPVARNNRGKTPYNLSSERGHQQICDLLMEYNVPPPLPRRAISSSSNDSHMGRRYSSSEDLSGNYSPPVTSLERNTTYPQPNQQVFFLPRPHNAGRSTSNGSYSNSPITLPSSQAPHAGVSHQHAQYVDFSLNQARSGARNSYQEQPLSARLINTSQEYLQQGPFTARDRPTPLFQGLQLNNPLTARHGDNEFHSQNRQGNPRVSHFQALHSPVVQECSSQPFHGTSTKEYSHEQQHQAAVEAEPEEIHTAHPLEEFNLFGTKWQVYLSDEGYKYYLDSATQHSQWDDPRTHGILKYDEVTGEYVAETHASGILGGNSAEYKADSLPTLQTEFKNPRKVDSSNKRRSNKSKPVKVKGSDTGVFSSDDDGSNVLEWSFSRRNGNLREVSRDSGADSDDDFDAKGSRRSRSKSDFRSRRDRSAGGRGAHLDNEIDKDILQDERGSDEVAGSQIRRGVHIDNRSEVFDDDIHTEKMMSGDMFRKNGSRNERNARLPINSGNFSDVGDPQFLLSNPEESSCPVDEPVRTNCFSPDRESLQRAAVLQRSLTPPISVKGSPSSSDKSINRSKKFSRIESSKRVSKTKGVGENLKSERKGVNSDSDESDNVINRSATLYSDGDESGSADSSDWDADSEVDDKPAPDTTLSLRCSGRASQHSNRKKPQSVKPSAILDNEKLKKSKIFSTEDGSYGNGGNILTSEESTKKNLDEKIEKLSVRYGGESPRPRGAFMTEEELQKRVTPYIDMLKQGAPLLTVKNSMARAGETRELVKLMLETADMLHISTDTDIVRTSAEDQVRPDQSSRINNVVEDLSVLKDDPKIGKYVKMHKMGVPAGNIDQKMKMDGCSSEDVNRLMVAIGARSEEFSSNTQSNVKSESTRSSGGRKASVPLLKVHWNPLPAEKLENSIFANGQDDSMQDEEFEELEKLFGAQAAVKNSVEKAPVPDNRMRLHALDSKRAQNVVIGLAHFKNMASHEILLGAVCCLDSLNNQLSADRLENLSQLLPSLPEVKRISDAEGSEHPAEVFFLLAAKFYPELPKRLACFITILTFEESAVAISSKMKKVIDACNEIISSDNLARVLQKMLTVGNLMNAGTFRGGASGFSLDSLLKMVHTKGVDKKTSVLDYVIKSLIDRGEQSVLAVTDDLSFDDETARISGKDTGREIDHLSKSISYINEVCSDARANESSSELVQQHTPVFVDKAQKFLDISRDRMAELTKMRELMDRKIVIVVEYFGEDIATCETTKVFSVLKDFKRAFEFSRQSQLGRMERAKLRQDRSQRG